MPWSKPSVQQVWQAVETYLKGAYGVGRHQAQWNGHWQGRGPAPAGMYIVRISSADRTTSHRVLLVR